jgi:hypothetical protein
MAGIGPNVALQEVSLSDIGVGTFVFLRNARFSTGAETTSNPRYWVARVTSPQSQVRGCRCWRAVIAV